MAVLFCLPLGAAGAVIGGSRAYSSTVIPASLDFTAIDSSPSGLVLSGTASLNGDQGVSCLRAGVNATTFALFGVVEPLCDSPLLSGHAVAAVQEQARTMVASVRIARLSPSGQVELGPIVVRYEEGSDTHLESAYADGSLWLYVPDTPSGGRALRISEATGQVVQDTRVSPAMDRPLIAADANGLYLAPDATTGFLGRGREPNENGIVYHVGVGASSVQVLDSSPHSPFTGYVSWLIAEGNSVWIDVCQRPRHSSCAITRIDGSSAKPVFRVPDRNLTGYWVIGSASQGFYIVSEPSDATGQPTVLGKVVRIDPATGAVKVIASVPLPEFWQGDFYNGSGEAALFRGSLYLLVPPNNQTAGTLYRVPLPATS